MSTAQWLKPESVIANALTCQTSVKRSAEVAEVIVLALVSAGYVIIDRAKWEGPTVVPSTGAVVEGMRQISPGVWVERDAAGNVATIEVHE